MGKGKIYILEKSSFTELNTEIIDLNHILNKEIFETLTGSGRPEKTVKSAGLVKIFTKLQKKIDLISMFFVNLPLYNRVV